jgi:two-component system, NtrC family, sensor histidine kinase KinB
MFSARALSQSGVSLTRSGGVRASERSARQTTDEGSRIPPEEHELIFDRFYQSPYNQLSRRGTGIWLTIAKRFTEIQGGQLAVVSEPGRGSIFWVTVPAPSGPVRKVGDTQEVAS